MHCFCSLMLCIGGLPPIFSMHYYLHFRFFCQVAVLHVFQYVLSLLLFRERSTCRLLTVTGAAALDIHMIRHTLVIAVMNAFYSLTVDADGLAGMRDRTGKRIRSFSLVVKAFAAGIITVAGMLSCHHDISFTAQTILIIGTTLYDTFQICHISLTFCRSRRPSFFVTKQFVTGQKLHLQKDTRQMRRRSPTTRHPYFVRCAEKYTYYWIFSCGYDIFLLLAATNYFIL